MSFLTACSLYKSDGREQLEKNALHLAAQANLTGCSEEMGDTNWTLTSTTESADIYTQEVQMIVKLKAANFECSYTFLTSEEMVEKTDSAVALTETEYQELRTAN